MVVIMKRAVVALSVGLGVVALSGDARAALSVGSPGACLKGGTAVQLSWGSDGDHYLAAYNDGSGGSSEIGHPITTNSVSWSVPSVTASGFFIYVESHPAPTNHSKQDEGNSPTFSIDSSGPTTPTALGSASKTQTSVNLSWNASSDPGCKGLGGYKIFRNGSQVGTSTSPSFTVTGLSAGTSYSFKVKAFDDFAESGESNTVTVTTDSAGSSSSSPPPPSPSPAPADRGNQTFSTPSGEVSPGDDGSPGITREEQEANDSASPQAEEAPVHPAIIWGGAGVGAASIGGAAYWIWRMRKPPLPPPPPPEPPEPPKPKFPIINT